MCYSISRRGDETRGEDQGQKPLEPGLDAMGNRSGYGGLFTIAAYCITQSVLQGSKPRLVVSPLEEALAKNWLADLL